MSSSPSSPKKLGRFLSFVRGIVLAGVLGAAFWLGAKALREAPPAGGAAGGGAEGGAPAGPPPASVFVGPVQTETAREFSRVTGSLRAVARAEVAAKEAGALEEIFVDEGDAVKAGQTLIILDRRRIDAEIAEAKASRTAAEVLVTQREAESKRAQLDFEMKTGLYEKRAVSRTELLDSEREKKVSAAQVKAASDQLNVAKSRLALLEVREDDLEVTAPFQGRIVERHVEPGEWVSPGEPVVSLVSNGLIEAWLDVPERFAAAVADDPSALKVVAEAAGLSATATSLKRIAEVDMRSRLFKLVATIEDHGGDLIHGMSVHADIPLGEPQAMLVVPVDAVIVTRLGEFVYRVIPAAPGEEGAMPMAERVEVNVRFRRDGRAFLGEAGSLSEGDQIVVEGNERLLPGQPLMISADPAIVDNLAQPEVKP